MIIDPVTTAREEQISSVSARGPAPAGFEQTLRSTVTSPSTYVDVAPDGTSQVLQLDDRGRIVCACPECGGLAGNAIAASAERSRGNGTDTTSDLSAVSAQAASKALAAWVSAARRPVGLDLIGPRVGAEGADQAEITLPHPPGPVRATPRPRARW